MTRRVRIGQDEARRIACAAQAFDRPRPGARPDVRHFRRVLDRLSVLQLDFVNVLLPAHFLVIWSRLGPYDRSRFERFVYDSGEYTEQWAHEASIVPSRAWPLLHHRREDWQPHRNNPLHRLDDADRYLATVLDLVVKQGAVTAHDLPPVAGPKRRAGDWHRSMPRWALEHHFATGRLAVRSRRDNFQRVYDLPSRVIPPQHLAQRLDRDEARRRLLRQAADALGIATRQDLADYYRMSPAAARPRIEELVEAGDLRPVEVEGWAQPAYLAASARFPREIPGASLMSPFDPLVWYRPRAERLFGFHYRIEIYVPAAERRWGYYVLPFRCGDKIVARVDLKAERGASELRVRRAYLEEGEPARETASRLAAELRELADWLGLERVSVAPRGDFSKLLVRQECLKPPALR